MKAALKSSARPFPEETRCGLTFSKRRRNTRGGFSHLPPPTPEKGVDLPTPEPSLGAFRMTNTPETKSRSLSPDEIPFHNSQSFGRYTTDTGKLLPRKYTRMSAKQQRRVTKTIKRARNIHLMA